MKGYDCYGKKSFARFKEDNDLTQHQICQLLRISQVAYSYYELGKRSIPLESFNFTC